MSNIIIEGIRLYAYHGCLEEEGRIGANYIVYLNLQTDLDKAAESDLLEDTVDYSKVYDIVKAEMAIRSKLLEHVAKRIIKRLKAAFPRIDSMEVQVTKINPPMNGDVEKVSVLLKA